MMFHGKCISEAIVSLDPPGDEQGWQLLDAVQRLGSSVVWPAYQVSITVSSIKYPMESPECAQWT